MSYHKRDTCLDLTITLCASSREEDAWYESTFGGRRQASERSLSYSLYRLHLNYRHKILHKNLQVWVTDYFFISMIACTNVQIIQERILYTTK